MKNKINVNMAPNPLDLQTLHCSQGDTSGRKFQFTLHNQGEVYDLSNISDPVFTSFPVEVGGTEELQPVNGTSPSTSPIIADITYPDGLREGEEFTYRESPTTISGEANFEAVYGNTLVWNQQMPISSVASYSGNGVTANNNNDGSYTINGTATNVNINYWLLGSFTTSDNVVFTLKKDHKYLTKSVLFFGTQSNTGVLRPSVNTTVETWSLFTVNTSDYLSRAVRMANLENGKTYSNYKVYPMIIDLTAMGLGSITTVDEFTKLFPLSYYEYNTGELLSFNGTGIKTVGKNLLNADDVQVGKAWNNTSNSARACTFVPVRPNTTYTISATSISTIDATAIQQLGAIGDTNPLASVSAITSSNLSRTFTTVDGCFIVAVQANKTSITKDDYVACEFQLEIGSSKTTYEQYKGSTASLPALTYFPTGMKSAGTVRDELKDNEAVTRVGTRAYQSGDESDTSVTTDGTNTNYALATEVVQSITSTSLITENGEAPLYHNGECLECECNEDISSEPGFHVAKIKFTDGDGSNYSNKIQLHVERSPQ